jgi:pimeloyl-ACP methyl ester carboxylesterase
LFKNEYKWEEIINKISCPILLITADKGIIPDKLAQKIIDVSKAGKWVKIEGAGHSIRREQFKQYVQTTKEFLD